MSSMFYNCSAFNQPLSFVTSAVTNMSSMFANAPAFDQNIGSWNVANVLDFNGFMTGKTDATFSTTNLDAIYNGWSTQAVQLSLDITFGTAKYTAAATAGRLVLTGTKLWTITDDGPAQPPVNTSPPVLSVKFRYEGELVTTKNGTWDNSPTSFTYQWYRDATPISGETLIEYILTSADVDTEVTCQVTAINETGSSTPEPSDAIYIFDYDYAQVYYYYEDTDGAKAILQNQFMIAIKAAGVWDKLDVLCVFRGSGDKSAAVDWKRLTEVTNIDCVFDTTQGFIGDASIPAYIDTNFATNAGTNFTQNDASRYFFPYAFSGAGPMDGSTGGGAGSRNRMLLNNSTDHKINQQGAVPLSSAFQYTTTVQPKSIHRTSATDVTLFNGTTSANRTAVSAVSSGNLFILRNDTDYADHTVAAYAAGASMVAENTAFLAAWNTYITAL